MSEKDFDKRIYEYLQDKFPNHKLSEYEESTTFLACLVCVEVNKQVDYWLKYAYKKR